MIFLILSSLVYCCVLNMHLMYNNVLYIVLYRHAILKTRDYTYMVEPKNLKKDYTYLGKSILFSSISLSGLSRDSAVVFLSSIIFLCCLVSSILAYQLQPSSLAHIFFFKFQGTLV